MSVVAKKYIISERFKGLPKRTDLKIEEENLPAIKDGGKFAFDKGQVILLLSELLSLYLQIG